MITRECRPQRINQVFGQDIVKKTLLALSQKPKNCPKVIILNGPYGTGKTSLVRAFARAANCQDQQDGDSCGHCSICQQDIENSPYYSEYDSAIIGNIESVKVLREHFDFNSDLGYKIICLDEAHLISAQAQAALLKVFEEACSRTFFVLCTTNIEKILNTIRSRSLILNLDLISHEDMFENIKNIIQVKQIDMDDNTINLIIDRSRGHMRDAHMMIDNYQLLSKEDFIVSISSAREYIIKFLICCYTGRLDDASRFIRNMQRFTLADLKIDYENVILEIMKVSLNVIDAKDNEMKTLKSLVKTKNIDLYYILADNIIINSFTSDKALQAACWVIYTKIQKMLER